MLSHILLLVQDPLSIMLSTAMVTSSGTAPRSWTSMMGFIIGLTADGRSIDSLALHYYEVLEFLTL